MNALIPLNYLIRMTVGALLTFAAGIVMPASELQVEGTQSTSETPVAKESAKQLPVTLEVESSNEAPPNSADADPKKVLSPRMRAHDRFLFLYDGERYAEASGVGLEVVDLTREEFGARHISVAAPLVNLAISQAKSGDLPAAEVSYEESVSIIEEHEGVLSPRLINPLSGLGSAYNKAGLYEKGAAALERALLINHVNDGLFNFEQFKIQDGLSDSYSGMNALDDATFYQKAQVEIHQRKLGADSPEVATALYKLAQWYERINNTEDAMLAYRKADRILRKAGGDANVERVEALQGIAKVYERQGLASSTASTLKKALSIIDEQPEPDYLKRAKILVALGDLYTRQGKFESSELHYSVAWEDLSRADKYLDQRDAYFSEPVRVLGIKFSTIEYRSRGKPDTSLKNGYVMVNYTVTEKGRVKDAKIIESEPAGLMDRSIISTYRRSAYRPRRVDGAATSSTGRISRHEFKYSASLEKEEVEKSAETSPDSDRSGERLEYPEKSD
jgi:TonB family protein